MSSSRRRRPLFTQQWGIPFKLNKNTFRFRKCSTFKTALLTVINSLSQTQPVIYSEPPLQGQHGDFCVRGNNPGSVMQKVLPLTTSTVLSALSLELDGRWTEEKPAGMRWGFSDDLWRSTTLSLFSLAHTLAAVEPNPEAPMTRCTTKVKKLV